MAMTRCRNGHFYDDKKHFQCPYCGVQGVDLRIVGANLGFSDRRTDLEGQPTVAKTPESGAMAKSAEEGFSGAPKPGMEAEKTVGILYSKKGFDPVVGWLVCVEGPEKGKDYRLKAEKNFIGRSPQMDVAIMEDPGISREKHAIVSYNPQKNTFKMIPGESRGLVYLNDEEVLMPVDLKDRDMISLGSTRLLFVALCADDFMW